MHPSRAVLQGTEQEGNHKTIQPYREGEGGVWRDGGVWKDGGV